ncbi:MAG: PQQ-dependent sugar dehydrogenase [Anaerolineae bacterium]
MNSDGERGVLGITFDPNFSSNHYVYIYYTATTPTIHNRLSRFTANGDVVLAGSEVPLLDLDTLGAGNHNGGAIHFGADGKLYVGVGENAVGSNAQTLTNRLGKILRINSDGSIPTDNPFYGTATGDNRAIWAYGLRNPYTFTFQRGTGRMFINDVGQSTWEEINDGIAGSNYGWPTTEGYTTNASFRSPLYAYGHSSGSPTGCAIVGGGFYNPSFVQFPGSYVGKYFFADYCSNWIYYVDPSSAVPFTPTQFAVSTSGNPVTLAVGNDGSLYYAARGSGGVVNKISYPAGIRRDSIGIYRPSTNTFYLRNANSTGIADITVSLVSLGMDPTTFRDVPVVGDWNGDGIDTVGFYRRGRLSDNAGAGLFLLSNSNSSPQVDYSFILGNPSDTPIVGDWDGNGADSVGVFRPSNGLIYIKNTLSTGFADFTMVLGNPGDVGIAGDWDNDGKDSPGVYRPGAAPQFYLTNQVCNCAVSSDYNVVFGNPNDQPFTGDWNGDGRSGVGVYRTSNGITYLRNDPTSSGFSDNSFVYGINGDIAFGGRWTATGAPAGSGQEQGIEIAPTFQP